MKKIFSIASALMLALGMGMTSCSNDIDEVVTEQQPEMHKLYLSATAPNSPETRSYAEGVDGSDAIKITGWKDGDVIYGYYGIDRDAKKLAFTFNGDTHEFESESTTVTNDQIKYFVYGDFNFGRRDLGYDADHGDEYFYGSLWYNSLTIDVANNYTNIPMWGTASVEGDKLTTNMQLIDVAFLCLHNSSSASIDVIIARYSEFGYDYVIANESYVDLNFDGSSNEAKFWWPYNKNKANATVTTIGVGEKVYLPIQTSTSNTYTVQVFIGDNDTPFASKAQKDFTPGKIYKLNYSAASPATTGTAAATGIGNVGWVQLWADGPKFADRNVGANSSTDAGTEMTFTQAIANPFSWGPNWCTPSKADLDELVKAASNDADERNNAKVTCTYEQVEGVYCFKFTGKEDGYTENSVFFPAQYADGDYGEASYWSGTADGIDAWGLQLLYVDDEWYSEWGETPQNYEYLVRPVLKEN